MVEQAVKDTDRFVQQLMAVQEELGLAEQTNLVVTSDHGQMDISRIINPNVMLADYGFLTVDKEGKVTDWKAYCLSNGLSAVVYLKNPEDENPTTVGGNTIGSVKIPSSTIFTESFLSLTMPQATINPKKKVIKIDKLAVFIEIKIGVQSVMSIILL